MRFLVDEIKGEINIMNYSLLHINQDAVDNTTTCFKTKSFDEVCREIQIRLPDRPAPVKVTIYRNVKKYLNHGTSLKKEFIRFWPAKNRA